jgi:hypothetical protein
MRPVVLDVESFFTDVKDSHNEPYRFKQGNGPGKTTEEYVRHPWFELHGAAIKWTPTTSAVWYDERELRFQLANEDWSDVFLICHHAQWDGFALSHHYGVIPQMYGCTLSMGRLLLGAHLGVGLGDMRKHFGMPSKITPYSQFKGKHWREMSPEIQQLVADGACDEVESIWKLFSEKLAPIFPAEEYDVVDSIIRMFAQPALRADTTMLGALWQTEETNKATRLRDLGFDLSTDAGRSHAEAQLQSADRFADLLRAEGIEPETKEGKNGPIYAFAKKDDFMLDFLQEHENPRIRALAQARLGVKSTILQTRAETYGWMASRGPMPVYLRYSGAGTLRPSGGDGGNWLNLKRGSALRRAICAPEGFLLAPVDSSQIECRVLHYLAGGPDDPVIQKFRNNEDPYVDLASQFYGEQIYKPKPDDPRKHEMESKRGMGKQGRLMCGYGSSGKMFKASAKAGLYGPPVEISIEDANDFVQLYRDTNPNICAKGWGYWAQAGRMLARLADGDPIEWGPLLVADHRIYVGPGRLPMIYDTLEYFTPEPEEAHLYKEFERTGFWRLKTRYGWKTMWGSKLVQNICEGVSRVIVSQAMTRIKRQYGIRTLNWPYDELLLLIPRDGHEDKMLENCLIEMKRTPEWLPGLPLNAEGHCSDRYEK